MQPNKGGSEFDQKSQALLAMQKAYKKRKASYRTYLEIDTGSSDPLQKWWPWRLLDTFVFSGGAGFGCTLSQRRRQCHKGQGQRTPIFSKACETTYKIREKAESGSGVIWKMQVFLCDPNDGHTVSCQTLF